MANTTETDSQTLALLRALVTAFEDKKADNLTVLRVSEQSNITDFLVLATGNSEPHLRALRVEAEKVLDAAKVPIAGMDQGGFGSGWTVVDAYQIMIHFFTAEQRENYALEKLWRDAEVMDLKKVGAKSKVKPGIKSDPLPSGKVKAIKAKRETKVKSSKTKTPKAASAKSGTVKKAGSKLKSPAKPNKTVKKSIIKKTLIKTGRARLA